MAPVPYYAYARAQATTSSQAELAVLLYRGAVRFAAKARIQLSSRDLEGTHKSLLRAQEVLVELMIGFKPGSDQFSQDLFGLHNYIYERLYEANIRKDVAPLDEALRHLRELLETWESISLPPSARPAAASVVSIDRHC
ncbi:MAG: flagellar export chaperone FliS [Chloroflexota bacterium]|nr:MAG: flagellar export chaperone FliS [Chloroflexota bacterium]